MFFAAVHQGVSLVVSSKDGMFHDICGHHNKVQLSLVSGRTMAQVVRRRPLTAKARVRARARTNPCWICGGQSGTGTGFSPSSSAFPCQYIFQPSLSKLISSGECVIC
jgi:hypothetical protein